MFGVLIFCLNEGKFIRYALRGYLSSPLVKKIAVVEGCVRLNAHAANDEGLSRDNTAEVVREVMAEDDTGRIVYERMGWVDSKSTLQTRCIQLIEDTPGIEYYIVAGADEVYDPADLETLQKEIRHLGYPDVPLYEFIHFWKRPNLRARGSMWETKMHRCYRNHGPGMHFGHHAGPPLKPDGGRLNKGIEVGGVRVYHYTGMKDEQDIKDRLKFYRNRDNLGTDTWTNWQPGQPTQWTHGGGHAEAYDGPHPPAIADVVWDLVPGKLRPKTKVLISHEKKERDKVKDFVLDLAALCPVTVIGLTNPRWPGIEFRKLSNIKHMLKDVEMLVVANRNLTLKPVCRHNVIYAHAPLPEHRPLRAGYKVICAEEKVGKTWSGKAVQVSGAAEFLSRVTDLQVVQGGPDSQSDREYSIYSHSVGCVGKPLLPEKLGSSGRIRAVNTRPFVVVWDFKNPLPETMAPKHAHLGYCLRVASGREIMGYRRVVGLPKMSPGETYWGEFTIPTNSLRPGEYELHFDFLYKATWGRDRGVEPLKLLFSMDKRREIWVR